MKMVLKHMDPNSEKKTAAATLVGDHFLLSLDGATLRVEQIGMANQNRPMALSFLIDAAITRTCAYHSSFFSPHARQSRQTLQRLKKDGSVQVCICRTCLALCLDMPSLCLLPIPHVITVSLAMSLTVSTCNHSAAFVPLPRHTTLSYSLTAYL
jgi:hypothetical protein